MPSGPVWSHFKCPDYYTNYYMNAFVGRDRVAGLPATRFSYSSCMTEAATAKRYAATWNGETIAKSGATVVVEGNHYFPLADVHMKHLRPSNSHTTCS